MSGVIVGVAVFGAIIYAVVAVVMWGMATMDVHEAVKDHERHPSMYGVAETAGKLERARRTQRGAWVWPLYAHAQITKAGRSATQIVEADREKRAKDAYEQAMRDFEQIQRENRNR